MRTPLLRLKEPELTLGPGERAAILVASSREGAALADRCVRAAGGPRAGVALLPAAAWELLDPGRRLGAQLAEVQLACRRVSSQAARDRAIEALEGCEITRPDHAVDRRPAALHPASRARVALALALVARPALLVVEDAFAGLPVQEALALWDLLRRLQRRRRFALLLVAENPSLAALLGAPAVGAPRPGAYGGPGPVFAATGAAGEAEVGYLGEIAERGPAALLAGAPRHPLTGAISCAASVLGLGVDRRTALARRDPGRRIVLLGDLPPRGERPAGCPLHPRCPKATGRCATVPPPLQSDPAGRAVACHHPLEDPELEARLPAWRPGPG